MAACLQGETMHGEDSRHKVRGATETGKHRTYQQTGTHTKQFGFDLVMPRSPAAMAHQRLQMESTRALTPSLSTWL